MAEESAATVSSDQLAEYENQLNEINELLKATPDDASLLSVKADLEELLALTRGGAIATTQEATQMQPLTSPPPATLPPPDPVLTTTSDVTTVEEVGEIKPASAGDDDKDVPVKKKRKKLKAVKDFEVPAHLIPLESDSNGEKKRKKRAIKMLKNQWRERKKEVESTNKQQSWQSFNKKKRTAESSIFRTQDGVNTKVGVISAGSMTEFNERKRHQRT